MRSPKWLEILRNIVATDAQEDFILEPALIRLPQLLSCVHLSQAHNSAKARAIDTLNKARKKKVRSFRIVCGIHCSGSQLGPGSLCPLGTLSSQCPWRTIHYRCRCPSIKRIPPPELMLCKSIDFVVPDDRLRVGTETLTQFKSLTPCPDREVCPSSSQERHTPPPAFHIHISDSEVTVTLYPQSETLWFLPPLDSSFSSPKKPKLPSQVILASDQTVLPPWRPGWGSGVFKSDCDPVVVPKSHILLEAFLRLYARDLGKRIGSFAMAMIAYMEEYVDDDGLLDAKQLPEPLKTSYKELKEGRKPIRQWTNELKEDLGVFEESEDDRSW